MNASIKQLLDSFDALSDADKHRFVGEILRRVSVTDEVDPQQGFDAASPSSIGSPLAVCTVSILALLMESCGIWCLVSLWFYLDEAAALGKSFVSHKDSGISIYYPAAWGVFSLVFVLTALCQRFATRHGWRSRLAHLMTVGLPLLGFLFMRSAFNENVLSLHYLISWGFFGIAFAFAAVGEHLGNRQSWFFKVLLIITVELPIAGYVFLYSITKAAL